jgi:hypothetical protein
LETAPAIATENGHTTTAVQVRPFESGFEDLWRGRLQSKLHELMKELYMTDEFWHFLRTDIRMLNLYPLQWSDDIASRLEIDIAILLALMEQKV